VKPGSPTPFSRERFDVTDRLYYTDPYLREFDAEVLGVESLDDGRRAAILSQTAFYPSSGGQPFDTGTLGDARIVDVVDRDTDGKVLHVLEGQVAAGPVHGRIDWTRRFDHMQQHTGQHLLSAAFDRLHGVRTMSFHLGTVSSTIDLAREVSPGEIAAAESEANRVVWDDVPVTIRFADSAEVAKMPLRKEPAREGLLRLIEVEGFDLSACGGTHVNRTGAIGIIAVATWEKFRSGTRIEFLCGGRALGGYRLFRDVITESIRRLSIAPGELPAGIDRLQNESKELKRQLRDMQTKLAAYEAETRASRAATRGSMRVVAETLEGWDQNGLKTVAAAIAERPGHLAILFGSASPSFVVVARAADVPVNAGEIVKRLTARFGGKGGGRPELAQGGGLTASPAELVDAALTLV
jgi:alanyl-tRNA synthetase